MRKLRYSINVTLDGCVDHRAGIGDPEAHHRATQSLASAGGLIFGRVTYEMMQDAWRLPLSPGMPEWSRPFAETIDAAKKYVVSSTLRSVDWNAELVHGDVGSAIQELKAQPGADLLVSGVTLPTALATQGLIDVYEFTVLPRVVGHGPSLLAGLRDPLDLELVEREEYPSGAVRLQYRLR